MSKLQCRYHPKAGLIEDGHAGDMICTQCGLVVGDRLIDVSSEWRTFSNDRDAKDMSRVGGPENELLEGADLGSQITHLPGAQTQQFDEAGRALLKTRKQVSSTDRTLLNAFHEIGMIGGRLTLSRRVIEQANSLFKTVHATKKLRGRGNDSITAACLYYICRQEKVPRTFKEVCAVCRVSRKEIGKSFKKIMAILNQSVQSINVEDYMSRFCSNLHLDMQIQNAAKEIARRSSELNLVSSRSPVSVAAASIYMAAYAAGKKTEKKDIGDVAGVAETTITATYKQMRPMAGSLFPSNFQFEVTVNDLPS